MIARKDSAPTCMRCEGTSQRKDERTKVHSAAFDVTCRRHKRCIIRSSAVASTQRECLMPTRNPSPASSPFTFAHTHTPLTHIQAHSHRRTHVRVYASRGKWNAWKFIVAYARSEINNNNVARVCCVRALAGMRYDSRTCSSRRPTTIHTCVHHDLDESGSVSLFLSPSSLTLALSVPLLPPPRPYSLSPAPSHDSHDFEPDTVGYLFMIFFSRFDFRVSRMYKAENGNWKISEITFRMQSHRVGIGRRTGGLYVCARPMCM